MVCVLIKFIWCLRLLCWDLVFLCFIKEFSIVHFTKDCFNFALFLLPMWWMNAKRLVWNTIMVKYALLRLASTLGSLKWEALFSLLVVVLAIGLCLIPFAWHFPLGLASRWHHIIHKWLVNTRGVIFTIFSHTLSL